MTRQSGRCSMPAGADRPEADSPDALVDTSVAVPLVVADHEHHEATVRAIGSRRVGLAGHAAFETFSVLTRLPHRRSGARLASCTKLLRVNFPFAGLLSAEAAGDLWSRLPRLRLAGGAVYDALVGAAAGERDLPLLPRCAGPWRRTGCSGWKWNCWPRRLALGALGAPGGTSTRAETLKHYLHSVFELPSHPAVGMKVWYCKKAG